ncbi:MULTISPECIES: STAS domain-containing protein [Treponema]|uniref:Anti-sigma factor antagonist n=1 Tax=Treponema saccharophilum DSM 2985 TaxID=907348 RepID=H7ENB0_9SPIR|nr:MULTISPECIES: STAS domain-containing protein [Treponema]EIC00838.1 anti-sigma-factor antagonist [Treponema saccharophilum DSM 2985]MBQ5538089.1 anti-sigma factor antagonist [Treponema sp.]BDC95242.1 anti-sigma factor antagonist [Treponema saccharophilum]
MGNNNNLVPGFNDERDDSLKINLEKLNDVENGLIIYLNGYIDTYNSSFFQKRIQKVVEAGFINLVFNCASLNYVSSTGIGSFTAFLKMIKPKGGDIVLLEIQPKVYEVFQLLGFSQFFNIKDSMQEASMFFKQGAPVADSIFPKIFSCPVCSKRLKATKSGRFRCSECKSILAINPQGQVFLG